MVSSEVWARVTSVRSAGLGGAVRREWLMLAAFLAGAAIRFYKLPRQILVDDEWHAVNKLLMSGYTDILANFGSADYSIPLTLFYRFMAKHLILTEWIMRTPSFLVGAASLLIVPLLLRPYIGRAPSILLSWLAALSPLMVYYSRLARPYSITLLLSVVAAVAFYRWWTETGSHPAWRWVYVLCAVLGPWINLACLPALLAPLAFGALELTVGRGRSLRRLLMTSLWTGAGLALFLAFPLLGRFQAISDKLGQTFPTWQTVTESSQLIFGIGTAAVLPFLGLLTLLGLSIALKRQRRFTLLLLLVLTLQAVSVLVLQPRHVDRAIALTRYLLIFCPVLLAFLAVGLIWLDDRLRRTSVRIPRLIPIPALAVLVFLGPLSAIYSQPNNWTNHALFQHDYDRARLMESLRPAYISQFYYHLARQPAGSLLLLEAPWYYNWHLFPYYQQIHRQRTLIGFVDRDFKRVRHGEIPLAWSGIRFWNAAHVYDHPELIRKGVDYVVFHKRLREEMGVARQEPPVDVDEWIEHYRGIFGEPYYQDFFLTVFDVSVRR